HLRWRIRNGSWAELHPKYVVITIGVNNIPADQVAEIFQGITGIVEDIRAKDSWVKILVVGPLPTKDRTSENRRTFDHVHKLLAAFPFPKGAIYDPLAYGLLDANGDLPANYFSKDGIHLLPDGYAEYARLLRKALEQMHE
ncbi:MAG TPA: GDSL-type esterase/lipase family protein, partial [Saprospiraceae bacterium]|nr:GDSL-type esterase/lipase family protein [Saprospiraceae bacterium]